MPLLSEADIVRAKQLLDAHQRLVEEYQARLADDSELVSRERGFLNIRGHEVVSDEVMEPPIGYLDQPDLMETIRRMIRSEQLAAALDGEETFEEADDFDVDDDIDPGSPYEMFFDPQPGAAGGPSDLATAAPSDLGDKPPAAAPTEPAGEPQRGGGGAEPPSGSKAASA